MINILFYCKEEIQSIALMCNPEDQVFKNFKVDYGESVDYKEATKKSKIYNQGDCIIILSLIIV